MPRNSMVAVTGWGFQAPLPPSFLGWENEQCCIADTQDYIPVEDNDRVTEPVGGVVTASDVGTNAESPVQVTVDGDANTLAPRAVDILGNNSLRSLCHGVDFTNIVSDRAART